MCGILALLGEVVIDTDVLLASGLISSAQTACEGMHHAAKIEDFTETLVHRGPDLLTQVLCQTAGQEWLIGFVEVNVEGAFSRVQLAGSLLQLRGEQKRTEAIAVDSAGNALMFNGQIYSGVELRKGDNDVDVLSAALSRTGSESGCIQLLRSLIGPWSLVYWKKDTRELWFGRDAMGRRSLLFHYHPIFQQCILSSTVPFLSDVPLMHATEVPPAIYRLKLVPGSQEATVEVRHRWQSDLNDRHLCFTTLTMATEAFLVRIRNSIKIRYEAADWGIHAGVLVLFSGGVDSTLIAALLHEVVPLDMPIDLCNVSFNNSQAPDRINSIDGLAELKSWAPGRNWRLICVDSSLEETESYRDRLLNLLSPCNTIMDLNIGSAIWLAARADGYLYPSGTAYTSQARIVFVGHGADEQCVGNPRTFRFREGGWSSVEEELKLEMTRLWSRNLGRDDRLISDHGREARLPFLDEHVSDFLQQLPLQFLFDPTQPRGIGEKMLLRESLRQLGLSAVATREKRAIQFGSFISKLTNRNQFGSNRAANKHHAGTQHLNGTGQ